MSEIEKAREALVEKLMLEGGGTREEAEDVVSYFAPFIEASARVIAREEIEAALGIDAHHLTREEQRSMEEALRLSGTKRATINQEGGDPHSSRTSAQEGPADDKSPPAVEAPAAGACPYCNGSGLFLGGRLSVRPPKCPRCYGTGKAEDVSPRNAVEAEAMEEAAAGDSDRRVCAICGFTIDLAFKAEKPTINFSTAGRAKKTAEDDTTALARRLAEVSEWGSAVLKNIIASDDVVGQAVIRLIEDALAEARKHKLIE